jgi:hypothetical protein
VVFCSSDPEAAMTRLRERLDRLGARVTAQQQSRTPELEYEARGATSATAWWWSAIAWSA